MTAWAFVTGADRGLGLSLAKGLLERGYSVFAGQYASGEGVGRTAEQYSPPYVSELERLEERSEGRLRRIPLDLGDERSVERAAAAVADVTDRLDILINNGAILGDIAGTIGDELNFAEMEQVFRVNALGSLRMSNKLIGTILRSDSKLIVNISSEAGSIGSCWRTSWYGYCMSKAALNMQSRLIHNDIAPKGGKVMVLHPGHVQSYMQGKLDVTAKLTPEKSAEHILALVRLRLDPGYTETNLPFLDDEGRELPW